MKVSNQNVVGNKFSLIDLSETEHEFRGRGLKNVNGDRIQLKTGGNTGG